jgi:peptide/nickel transport system substrate-binding protein
MTTVTAAQDPSDQPGPAADTLRFNSYFVDRAPLEVQAGTMDLYLFGLRTEAAQELRDAPGVQLFQAPATSLSLVLNPAPARRKLNPFAIPEVRTACSTWSTGTSSPRTSTRPRPSRFITQVSPSDSTS